MSYDNIFNKSNMLKLVKIIIKQIIFYLIEALRYSTINYGGTMSANLLNEKNQLLKETIESLKNELVSAQNHVSCMEAGLEVAKNRVKEIKLQLNEIKLDLEFPGRPKQFIENRTPLVLTQEQIDEIISGIEKYKKSSKSDKRLGEPTNFPQNRSPLHLTQNDIDRIKADLDGRSFKRITIDEIENILSGKAEIATTVKDRRKPTDFQKITPEVVNQLLGKDLK